MESLKKKMKFGLDFDLKDDDMILKINSPKKRLDGPYAVVAKNMQERWAIVAFRWEKAPSLGIRWFFDQNGHPISNSHPTWLVLTPMLTNIILSGLQLDSQFRDDLNRFLAGKMTGEQLKEKGDNQ